MTSFLCIIPGSGQHFNSSLERTGKTTAKFGAAQLADPCKILLALLPVYHIRVDRQMDRHLPQNAPFRYQS